MVRKKRTRKPLDNEDIDDMDDIEDVDMDAVTDSEEEYTETEKKLLEKVRKQRTTENFDSDDEVYGLQDESEVEEEDDGRDSMESDIEGAQEDYDMPNDRAWGTKAKAFYSSDFKYTDYASAPEKDLVNADMEEEEGRRLHLRSMGQHLALDGSSFSKNKAAQVIEDSKVVRKDSTQLSDKEFFMIMVKLFKDYMTQAKDILAPFLELVKDGTCPECNAVAFIRTKYEIILNYCTNISFLLMLQTKGLPVKSHPVVKRLAQYRHLIGELESKQGDLLEQVAEILKAIKEGRPIYSISDGFQIQSSKKSPRLTSLSKKLASKKEAVTREEQSLSDSMDEEASIEDLDTEEKYDGESVADEKDTTILNSMNEKEEAKRAITYQMAKNRGLTPYRKKELRNPRVKHRNKYRKAKIRRKGAVREVRKELTRYAGEISGIKAGVKKGIKLK